jgi:uncharacterized Ntn-hydrolase superfamily protein
LVPIADVPTCRARQFSAGCALVLTLASSAQATWSIVAVDPRTREVGSAGASCTPSVAGIVALVPGHGAIVAQAMSNAMARRRGAALLARGGGPSAVIAAISHPSFDESYRDQQYGVASLDFYDRPAAFTGAKTHASAGQLLAPGVAVLGNTLTGQDVLTATMDAFQRLSDRPLAERLMGALAAGGEKGGDRRCGAQTAQSAYLVVARPDDPTRRPAVRHIIPAQREGGPNPVHLLRMAVAAGRAD